MSPFGFEVGRTLTLGLTAGLGLFTVVMATLYATAPPVSLASTESSIMSNAPTSSRPPPPKVAPVEYDGVRYEQDGFGSRASGDQPGGYLAAIDARSGARLWRLKVYEIADQSAAGVETFARHFRSMRLVPGRAELEVESETGSRYLVDLAKRTSTLLASPPPASPHPPDKPKPKAP